jgi:hypothetical protein
MAEKKDNLFVEDWFKKFVKGVTNCTAHVQARLIPQRIANKYDRSECCATAGIIIGIVILLISWFMIWSMPRGVWWAVLIRTIPALIALWLATRAFFYPLKVVLVDLPAGGPLKSPTRSIILLFFNYVEITIHFASVYLLSLSIGYTSCQKPITCPLESLYFSIVTITTLGYGDIRPVHWIGRTLVSVEVLVGIALIVTALAIFLSQLMQQKNGEDKRAESQPKQS